MSLFATTIYRLDPGERLAKSPDRNPRDPYGYYRKKHRDCLKTTDVLTISELEFHQTLEHLLLAGDHFERGKQIESLGRLRAGLQKYQIFRRAALEQKVYVGVVRYFNPVDALDTRLSELIQRIQSIYEKELLKLEISPEQVAEFQALAPEVISEAARTSSQDYWQLKTEEAYSWRQDVKGRIFPPTESPFSTVARKARHPTSLIKVLHGVLDSGPTPIPFLDGTEEGLTLPPLLETLSMWSQGSADPRITSLHLALQRCQDIEASRHFRDALSCLRNRLFPSAATEQLVQQFHQDLLSLPDLDTPHPLPFPMRVDGHAFMGQVEYTEEEGYSFTIINTGDGTHVVGSLSDGRSVVQDIQYTHLTSNELSLDFFRKFLLFPGSMRKGLEFIAGSLGRRDEHGDIANQAFGRRHIQQQKGTCQTRAQLSCMRGWLGKELYASYRLYLTQRLTAQAEEFLAPENTQTVDQRLSLLGISDETAFNKRTASLLKDAHDEIEKWKAKTTAYEAGPAPP